MKLLLQLTFFCLLVSSTAMAQQNNSGKIKDKKEIVRKGPKISKNNAVVRINEVPARPAFVTRSSNRNSTRRERIVEANVSNRRNSAKKVSHRDMIAKRKRIVENY